MTDVNWGALTPLNQMSPIRSQSPMANPVSPPQNPQGGLLGGLKNAFGTNPISIANQALNGQLQNTPGPDLAKALMGQTTPTSMAQQTNQAVQGNGSLSIPGIQGMASQSFPNDPIRQQLATLQATQESNLLGKPSQLATGQNNLFGMSGHDVTMNNKAGNDLHSYASYKSPQESVDAYAKLLQNSPRYRDVMAAKTLPDAITAIGKSGYATDPTYAAKLSKISSNIFSPESQKNSVQAATQVAGLGGASTYDVAKSYLGEGRGKHADVLGGFFKKALGRDIDINSTPWCAGFANAVLASTGHAGTGSLAAKSFLNIGQPTTSPSKGDIAVFNDLTGRNSPVHGHVGFVDSIDPKAGTVSVLGGNQDGKVSIKTYPLSKVAGFRVPPTAQDMQATAAQPRMQVASLNPVPGSDAETAAPTPIDRGHDRNVPIRDLTGEERDKLMQLGQNKVQGSRFDQSTGKYVSV